jgi:hypothetical protein
VSISTLSLRTTLLVALLVGCAGPDDLAEEAQLDCATQAFSSASTSSLHDRLAPHILSSSIIRVCINSSTTVPDAQTQQRWVKNGLAKWIAGAATVSKEPLFDIDNLLFSCERIPEESQPGADVGVLRVFWSEQPGRARYANSNVYLYAGDDEENNPDDERVVLHELGHAFGLGDTYAEGSRGPRPGQPDSVMAGGRTYLRLQPDDTLGIQQVFCEVHPDLCIKRFESSEFYCRGDNLYLGDFNRDGKSDSLCHDAHGEITIDYNEAGAPLGASQFFNNLQFCRGDGAKLFTADVTGDRRDELLCHERSGRISIHYANSAGRFIDSPVSPDLVFCTQPGARVHVGDFNNDLRADLLCHEPSGIFSVALADTSGRDFIDAQEHPKEFCPAANGSESPELHVGDFDGDLRADLLCHHPLSGKEQIVYAAPGGMRFGSQWEDVIETRRLLTPEAPHKGWCSPQGSELRVGFFNRDALADLLCLTPRGDLDVVLAEPGGTFVDTARTSWPQEWCARVPWRARPPITITRHLLLGDFDANGTTDMLCYTPEADVTKTPKRELWLGQTRLPGERR